MLEERVDDGMIEIGDPTEESSHTELAPRVVIEYRERGVPWMLIPPLLILSALGAVLLHHKFAPLPRPPQPPTPIRVEAPPETPLVPSDATAPPSPPAAPAVATVEKPAEVPVIAPVAAAVESPESVPDPTRGADPDSFPRVQGLGFDPKALEAERKAEAPADNALAPALQEARPDDRDQPREVDPELLPPDPLLARARQKQRCSTRSGGPTRIAAGSTPISPESAGSSARKPARRSSRSPRLTTIVSSRPLRRRPCRCWARQGPLWERIASRESACSARSGFRNP